MATAKRVQLGPSVTLWSGYRCGSHDFEIGYCFPSTRPTRPRSQLALQLGVCIQFSMHEMKPHAYKVQNYLWRGSSESHTIRVTLSFGKACVRILRPFTVSHHVYQNFKGCGWSWIFLVVGISFFFFCKLHNIKLKGYFVQLVKKKKKGWFQ